MNIPPIGGPQYVRGSDSNESIMQQVETLVSQIQKVMTFVPPQLPLYEGMRNILLNLLGPNPEVQSTLPSPFAQFVLHGIIYQCDAYFNLNNPLYPTATSDPEVQQGICVGLMDVFGLISTTTSFPSIPSDQIATFAKNIQALITAIKGNDSSGAGSAVTNLENMHLPSPYDALVNEINTKCINAFSPPSGTNENYFIGMIMGIGSAFSYLTAPNYETDTSYDGDFQEALKVYGDYEFAETDAQLQTWRQPGSTADIFNQLYNPVSGLLIIPQIGQGGGDPYTLYPQDWLNGMILFLTGGSLNPPNSNLMTQLIATLSPQDQAVINGFLNGVPPVKAMVNNWDNGGKDEYQICLNNGIFQQVVAAAQNLLNAWLKNSG